MCETAICSCCRVDAACDFHLSYTPPSATIENYLFSIASTHIPSSSTNFCEKSLTVHLIPLRRHLEQLDSPGLISQRILCRLHSAPASLVNGPSTRSIQPQEPSYQLMATHMHVLWISSAEEVVRQELRKHDGFLEVANRSQRRRKTALWE